jgi:hypothetical protein
LSGWEEPEEFALSLGYFLAKFGSESLPRTLDSDATTDRSDGYAAISKLIEKAVRVHNSKLTEFS